VANGLNTGYPNTMLTTVKNTQGVQNIEEYKKYTQSTRNFLGQKWKKNATKDTLEIAYL
jgi:hypothetical protein